MPCRLTSFHYNGYLYFFFVYLFSVELCDDGASFELSDDMFAFGEKSGFKNGCHFSEALFFGNYFLDVYEFNDLILARSNTEKMSFKLFQ